GYGNQGKLCVRLHCPPSAPSVILKLQEVQAFLSGTSFNLFMDIKNGIIQADDAKTWLGSVSVGLAVGLLRVLCQPKQDPNLNMLTALGQFCGPLAIQNGSLHSG
ncbi:unnamed protein product, partial [Meganyctiphanes norvegica]